MDKIKLSDISKDLIYLIKTNYIYFIYLFTAICIGYVLINVFGGFSYIFSLIKPKFAFIGKIINQFM